MDKWLSLSTTAVVLLLSGACVHLHSSGSTLALDYYPVAVGNTWRYESSLRGPFTQEVVAREAMGGEVRYRVESTDSRGARSHLFVRVAGPHVYRFTAGGEGGAYMDFSVRLGESFTSAYGALGATVTHTAHHESLTLSGSEYRDVREYRHQVPQGEDYHSFWARGIGLVGLVYDRTGVYTHLVDATFVGGT